MLFWPDTTLIRITMLCPAGKVYHCGKIPLLRGFSVFVVRALLSLCVLPSGAHFSLSPLPSSLWLLRLVFGSPGPFSFLTFMVGLLFKTGQEERHAHRRTQLSHLLLLKKQTTITAAPDGLKCCNGKRPEKSPKLSDDINTCPFL